jgi:hypothetical protein
MNDSNTLTIELDHPVLLRSSRWRVIGAENLLVSSAGRAIQFANMYAKLEVHLRLQLALPREQLSGIDVGSRRVGAQGGVFVTQDAEARRPERPQWEPAVSL